MKTLFLSKLLLLLPFLVLAQTNAVKGVVRSQSDPFVIPGVSIIEKGTVHGTITDAQGQFTLTTTTPKPILVFSLIGFKTREVSLPSTTDSLHIFLEEDVSKLSEVVVVGYGTTRNRTVTGSVSGVEVSSSVPIRIRGIATSAASDRATHHTAPISVIGAGILTAGELNDFSKWKLWQDIAKTELNEWQKQWQISPTERYTVQLITEEGFPVMGAEVVLKDKNGAEIWRAQSDNTGKSELWKGLFSQKQDAKVGSIEATVDGKIYQVKQPTPFHTGVNSIKVNHSCIAPSGVDIAFVVDATSSMSDEIQYLQAELKDVITKVKDSLSTSTINLGSVFYRDKGDDYVTLKTNFSKETQTTIDFIKKQQAAGGGDIAEAVEQALEVAVEELDWSVQAKARLLFLILDAPPHENPAVIASLQQAVTKAAAKGIRIIPITASGIDKSTEYLMRAIALATNGSYVFLTDHSGVGNGHIKPTTDKYEVELLNTLLVKLIVQFSYSTDCSAQKAAMPTQIDTIAQQYSNDKDSLSKKNARESENRKYGWSYFPNPTPDLINVEMDSNVKELFVTDVTGKIILRAVPTQNKATISMANYSSGMYFLRFHSGKKWETGKFFVSH